MDHRHGTTPSPETPAAQVTGADRLVQEAKGRGTVLPWTAQCPGLAIERTLPHSEGWARLSESNTLVLESIAGDAPAAERVLSLSFYAYARPGQAVALVLDPFEADYPAPASGRPPRLVHWRCLHPDKRGRLVAKAFGAAVVAPSPSALHAAVRDRATRDPDPDVRVIWRRHTATLLRDLLISEAVDEAERSTLRTMAALGAFE